MAGLGLELGLDDVDGEVEEEEEGGHDPPRGVSIVEGAQSVLHALQGRGLLHADEEAALCRFDGLDYAVHLLMS